jgi:hypothetical protein
MSNTIYVKGNKNGSYYAFRWMDKQIQACIHESWTNVVRTDKKNRYGEFIFRIIVTTHNDYITTRT